MSQTLRQRQALQQAQRVLCDQDNKPGRGSPIVLRLRPQAERFEPRRAPWWLFAGILVWTVLVTAWAIANLPVQ